jgi:hypothetical protein
VCARACVSVHVYKFTLNRKLSADGDDTLLTTIDKIINIHTCPVLGNLDGRSMCFLDAIKLVLHLLEQALVQFVGSCVYV